MKKILLLLLLLSNLLLASSDCSIDDCENNVSLLDAENVCIYNDYYNKDSKFYYHEPSDPDTWHSTRSDGYSSTIIHSYTYDDNTSECFPQPWTKLGLTAEDFNFLNALIGLLFGFFMLVAVSYLFMTAGGKK